MTAPTNEELRKLLGQAAKAHGSIASDGIGGFYDMERDELWAPLLDDGDSRRLEVALRIHHRQYRGTVNIRGCWCIDGYVEAVKGDIEEREPIGNDPYAATRLAVLRVAAAIGEAMP